MSEPAPLLPVPDERSAPFFEGARRGRLLLQRCRACHAWHHPVRSRCADCGGVELAWEEASGRGTLYSWGVLRRSHHPAQKAQLPIALAVVDLEEGVRLSTNLVGAERTPLRSGLPVEVVFQRLSDDISIPVFRVPTTKPG